ncbi:MAG TPA: hypothetical protein PLH94_12575 [Fimbriimonadaceae bacterium]|nr:hypothetical protein [Fimbriimonadaceae bacterium]
MAHVMTVATVWAPSDKVDVLTRFQDDAFDVLHDLEGFFSVSVWKDLDFPERYAVLLHYASWEVAERAAELAADAEIIDKAYAAVESPPEVGRVLIDYRHGVSPGRVNIGQVLSISRRTAEPGHGRILEREVEGVFESMKYMDGYLGSVFGTNEALRDEVVGIAFWADRKSFDRSLPELVPYEIRLYERLR